CDQVWPLVRSARVVAGYHPMGSEIDPLQLLRHAMNNHISAAYPAFLTADSQMIFRSAQCAEDCPVGGVQPPHQAKEFDPDGWIGGWPVLVQALFYLVAGLLWIVPLRPLIRWIESGRWRAPPGQG